MDSSLANVRRLFLHPYTARILLVLVLLASFGLRIYRLEDKSVWWDEGLAAWSARQSLADISRWTSADVHPPLYFWMLHFWRLASGDSEFGLRMLSVCIGVLTVAAVFLLGQVVGGSWVGVLSALLIGLSRFDIWWSQEMRMYALAALLAVFSLWSALCFWNRDRWSDGVLYVVCTMAGLYTLYLYALVLVVVNLIWLWVLVRSERRTRALFRWGIAQGAVLGLFAPWLFYALGRIPTWSSASPVSPWVFLRIYWTVLTTGISISVERYLWLTLPVLAIFLGGLGMLIWTARRTGRVGRDVSLLLLAVLLPAGVVYLVSLPRETFFYSPQLAPRYLLIFAPAFYVLMAWGLSLLAAGRRWLVGAIATGVVLFAAIYGLWTYYPGRVLRDDYKALALTMHAYQQPEDAVILYTDKDWPVFAYHHPRRWVGVPHAQVVTPEYADAYLAPIWQEHQGIWLVVTPYAGVNDPQGQISAWLSEHAIDILEYPFGDKVLGFYARTEERASRARQLAPGVEPSQALRADLAPGLQLLGYDQPVQEYDPGDTIYLALYVQRDSASGASTMTLEVSLANGQRETAKRVEVVVPQDVQGRLVRQPVELAVPPDLAGGRYRLAVRSGSRDQPLYFGRVVVRPPRQAARTVADVHVARPFETDFANGVRLLGYDLKTEVLQPGDEIDLTLYWQAREPIERRYKVFTHVLGEVFHAESNNFLWGQQDNEPAHGTRPTVTWRTGEAIVDEFSIALDAQAPPGDYVIEIGLYDPATGERLAVLDDRGQPVADHVVLARVTVGGR